MWQNDSCKKQWNCFLMDKSYLKGKAELQKLREQSPEDRALSNVGKIRTTMNNIEDNRFENMSALSGSFYVKKREDKPGFNFGIWTLSQIEIEEQTLIPFSEPTAARNKRTPVLRRRGQQTAKGSSGQALTSRRAAQLSCKAPGSAIAPWPGVTPARQSVQSLYVWREAGCWAGLVQISPGERRGEQRSSDCVKAVATTEEQLCWKSKIAMGRILILCVSA